MAFLAFFVYFQVTDHDFITFDDYEYVVENENIKDGLNGTSIGWAFTSTHSANWHPLTWLSHMADVHFHGMNPGMHHLTNVILHTINGFLLLAALRLFTGCFWRPVIVAVLFLIHPLHVETVAWVSERKDILCTFWAFLVLISYYWYTRKVGKRYFLVLILFVFGLMSKPMLVTLPFVLLLLDYWPLRRLTFPGAGRDDSSGTHVPKRSYRFVLMEKVPFLAVAFASCVITLKAQQEYQAVYDLSFWYRLLNSISTYGCYIWKSLVPTGLSPFYPHPGQNIEYWQLFAAGALLLFITYSSIRSMSRHPFFIVGWLWFLGTMVPVIGIIQVGMQSMADRYTYIPTIGLYIMAAWGLERLTRRGRSIRYVAAALVTVYCLGISVAGHVQAGHWKDSTTLFSHALKLDENNWMAHGNLGEALFRKKDLVSAEKHLKKALDLNPVFFTAHYNIGLVYENFFRFDEAIYHYQRAAEDESQIAKVHNSLGRVYMGKNNMKKAIFHMKKALEFNPADIVALNNLGVAMEIMGRLDDAAFYFSEALKVDPESEQARNQLIEIRKLQEKKLRRGGRFQ